MAKKDEKKEAEIVQLRTREKFYATANHPYEEAGAELTAHPTLIDHLVKKGYAGKTADEAAKVKKKSVKE